jgi:hypothetical protein
MLFAQYRCICASGKQPLLSKSRLLCATSAACGPVLLVLPCRLTGKASQGEPWRVDAQDTEGRYRDAGLPGSLNPSLLKVVAGESVRWEGCGRGSRRERVRDSDAEGLGEGRGLS